MLIVFAGRPGTGKTTLSRLIAAELAAALIRVDSIEAAVMATGLAPHPVGPIGYVVAHQIAATCLAVGTPVVVDAVNPVAEARAGWPGLAATAGMRLHVVEMQLPDPVEHRRRVEQRVSDLTGLVVPSWADVRTGEYQPWDETRDGERLVVDGTDTAAALARIRTHLSRP